MTHHLLGDFEDFSLSVVVTSPPWYENCYLVRHRPSATMVVVDPGGDSERILAAIAGIGAAVVGIWLTHGHPDHLGAVHVLEQTFALPTRAHADEAQVIARASDVNRSFTGAGLTGPKTLDLFTGEPELALGGRTVRVIHTPGHTPGCVCYDFGPFVLTGDTLFQEGVGRTDLPGGNEAALKTSITRLLSLVDDGALLLSGHGPGWHTAEARHWWQMIGSR